jgi:hypothetical protein
MMVRFPQFVFRRPAFRQGQFVDHPDADALAAFGEQRLNRREREDVLAHLAQCPECRDILAFISMAEPNELVPARGPERTSKARWRHLRWAVPLAVTCLLIGIIRLTPPAHKPAPQLPAPAEIPRPTIPSEPPAVSLRPRAKKAPSAKVKQTAPAPAPPAIEAKATATSAPIEKPEITAGAFLPQQNIQQQEIAAPPATREIAVQAMSRSLLTLGLMVQRPKSLWSLGASGTIQKSSDGGRTWQSIHLSDDAQLYALSANGPNVWAGGAGGVLFHSADDGLHWTPVIVDDGEVRLAGTITGIEALSERSIRLKVRSEVGWVTSDGGLHWRRE